MEITVRNIINVLNELPPTMPVRLDKDGWLADEIEANTAEQLIERRGLFFVCNGALIINN